MQNAHRCVHKIIVQGSKCQHSTVKIVQLSTPTQKEHLSITQKFKKIISMNPALARGCSWVSSTPHIRLSLSSLAQENFCFWVLGTGCLGGSAISTFLQISTSPGQWLFLGVLEDPPKRPFGELSARNPPDDLGQLFPQAPEFTSREATMQWTMTKH